MYDRLAGVVGCSSMSLNFMRLQIMELKVVVAQAFVAKAEWRVVQWNQRLEQKQLYIYLNSRLKVTDGVNLVRLS
jgi:hypothetical protein